MSRPFPDFSILLSVSGFLDTDELVIVKGASEAAAWARCGSTWLPISKGKALEFIAKRLKDQGAGMARQGKGEYTWTCSICGESQTLSSGSAYIVPATSYKVVYRDGYGSSTYCPECFKNSAVGAPKTGD